MFSHCHESLLGEGSILAHRAVLTELPYFAALFNFREGEENMLEVDEEADVVLELSLHR